MTSSAPAIHEAAHTIAALYYGLPVDHVTLSEDGSGLTQCGRGIGSLEVVEYGVVLAAGRSAERHFGTQPLDVVDRHAFDDRTKLQEFLSIVLGIEVEDPRIEEQVRVAEILANAFVVTHSALIGRLADALARTRYLSGDQVRALIARQRGLT